MSQSERLGRVLLTSLILLATGMAALVANSPNDRDIDVEISYADLDRIREDVSREWSTKAIYRNECGMFRDSSDKNIMYVYMINPDWVEAQRIYEEIYWDGRHRVIPVKCNYSLGINFKCGYQWPIAALPQPALLRRVGEVCSPLTTGLSSR